MANKKVLHKRSNESGNEPNAVQLDYGELAINLTAEDEKIFIKNSENVVIPFIPKSAFVNAPIVNEVVYLIGTSDNGIFRIDPSSLDTSVYTFDMSLITSSTANVGVQLGVQNTNGGFVDVAWNVQGESGTSPTEATAYWTNETTEHGYNATVRQIMFGDNVFYVNVSDDYTNLTSANITTNMPLVNMAYCFNNCINLTSFEGSGVCPTNMANTFYNCGSLTAIGDWNVCNATNMSDTFYNCYNLATIGDWNACSVTNMSNTFRNCYNLAIIGDWNVCNATNMANTFNYCYNLAIIGNWNICNVTNMSDTFYNCYNIATIGDWNACNVTNMYRTFSNHRNLAIIGDWNVCNATNMSNTFRNCYNLAIIGNWNICNVTNMANTFQSCSNLTSLVPIANWDVANVTNMAYTFESCDNVKTHGFNNWTGPNANCECMFRYCNSLDDMQIHWNITCAANMFADRNTPLNVYASTATNAYNAIYAAMGNSTTNSNWNVTLYELNE